MEDKIRSLHSQIREISIEYLIYQKRNNIEQIKKIVPQIQEFVLWFLEENRYGIEQELYQGMQENLLNILQDILSALRQNDRVLLHDSVANGLMEYLELFVDTEQEDESDDKI